MNIIRLEKKLRAQYVGRRSLTEEGVKPHMPVTVTVRGVVCDLDGTDITSLKVYIGLTQVSMHELTSLKDEE